MPDDSASTVFGDLNDNFGWAGATTRRVLAQRIQASWFVFASAAVDGLALIGISLAMLACFVGFDNPTKYLYVTGGGTAVALLLFKANQLYKIELIAAHRAAAFRLVKIWTMAFLCLSAIAVLTKTSDDFSRLWLLSWYGLGLAALIAGRVLLSRLFRSFVANKFITHSVVVVGASSLTNAFFNYLDTNPYGVRIDAVFDDNVPLGESRPGSIACDGNLDDLIRYQKTHNIDTLVLCAPLASDERVRKILRLMAIQSLKIRVLPSALTLEPSRRWYAPMGEIPGVQLLTVLDRPIAVWGHLAKSIFDRGLAAVALFLLAPVLLACMIGIKLSSPGPIMFRQKRVGYRNENFEVYKFRSMHAERCDEIRLTERNDSRIFAFGQIMRKLSLDELPQIFNVLKGDMSLVGPRPHMPEARAAGQYYFDAVTEYAYRHRVKPGITGWAQVNGWRGPTETIEQIEQRVAHDLYYIDNWSLSLDAAIIVKTALVLFFDKNAF